jgi:hypothetical protein
MYIRGLAYLGDHQSKEAAEEFQKIIVHRGVSPVVPEWVLAHVQLGRAYALTGDITNLERRRPRHPHPEATQSRVREAGITF